MILGPRKGLQKEARRSATGIAALAYLHEESRTASGMGSALSATSSTGGGGLFQSRLAEPYEVGPPKETLRVYGGSDYAVTADGGDFTVHAVVGIDPEGKMYLLDRWRKQSSSDEWIEAFCDLRPRMEANGLG